MNFKDINGKQVLHPLMQDQYGIVDVSDNL